MEKGRFSKHIVQYSPEYSFCAGCNSCEAICSLTHDGVVSPTHNRIFLDHGDTLDRMTTILTCQQCIDHPCYDACPLKDKAMRIDDDGVVYVDEDECIGCGKCVKACVFEPPRIQIARHDERRKWAAKKCDMCRDRPEGPACVQYCPVRCLGVDTASLGEVVDPPITEEISLNSLEDRSHD